MEHAAIEQGQFIDRYLMGQLSTSEATQFEEHYLHCQDCLDQLEAAERLQGAVKRAVAVDIARVAARSGLAAWLGRLRGSTGGVLLGAVLGALLMAFVLPALRPTATAPQINTPILTLSPERSGEPGLEPSAQLALGKNAGFIVLSLELDIIDFQSYSLTLERTSGEVMWKGGALQPNHLDALVLSLPARLLDPGDYRVLMAGEPGASGASTVATFAFRVLDE